MKICRKKSACIHPDGPELKLTEFGVNNSLKDKLNSACKVCQREMDKIKRRRSPGAALRRDRRCAQKRKDNYHLLPKPTGEKICCRKNKCIHPTGPLQSVKEFSRYKGNKDGLAYTCKSCMREIATEDYKNNLAKHKAKSSKYQQENRGKVNANTIKYQVRKLNRTPAWVDFKAIQNVYMDCEEINIIAKMVGCTEIFHVDHKIPLKGKLVSGLHIAENLQIITASENHSKNNKFEPQYIYKEM